MQKINEPCQICDKILNDHYKLEKIVYLKTKEN